MQTADTWPPEHFKPLTYARTCELRTLMTIMKRHWRHKRREKHLHLLFQTRTLSWSVNISTANWAYRPYKLRKYQVNICTLWNKGYLAEGLLLFLFLETLHWCYRWDFTRGAALMLLTWYDSSPWADVFINKVFSTLPSSDGRKISLKDAFPLGGIT